MLTLLLFRRGWQRLAFALGRYFRVADAGFEFQQLQLQIAQRLAARAVLGDPLLAQPLFQNLDLQLRIFEFVRRRIQLLGCRIELPLQLLNDLCVGSNERCRRIRRRRRMKRCIHCIY